MTLATRDAPNKPLYTCANKRCRAILVSRSGDGAYINLKGAHQATTSGGWVMVAGRCPRCAQSFLLPLNPFLSTPMKITFILKRTGKPLGCPIEWADKELPSVGHIITIVEARYRVLEAVDVVEHVLSQMADGRLEHQRKVRVGLEVYVALMEGKP